MGHFLDSSIATAIRFVAANHAPHHREHRQPVDRHHFGGEQRGRDEHKNVDGRNRHIDVDSMGMLLAVLVTAANVDDAKAAEQLFGRLEGQPMSRLATIRLMLNRLDPKDKIPDFRYRNAARNHLWDSLLLWQSSLPVTIGGFSTRF